MATYRTKQISVLTMNTLAFTACFAVWVMFSIIGIPIKELLALNETQFGILIATPILTGSVMRLPVGIWRGPQGHMPDWKPSPGCWSRGPGISTLSLRHITGLPWPWWLTVRAILDKQGRVLAISQMW